MVVDVDMDAYADADMDVVMYADADVDVVRKGNVDVNVNVYVGMLVNMYKNTHNNEVVV